ncbi:MAG: hypothetical protein JHD16_15300, partial [Solirubrobacteraceae bacterium]|nr:hypothetical protein [Solirubrobacteraceae bacterium]
MLSRASLVRPGQRAALLLACGLAPLVAAGPASAACAVTPTKKAFSAFGDKADYSLLPGGSFESSTSGWSLGGGSVVSGNETFKVGAASDAKSLVVPARSRVVSPKFCVGVEHPTFRLFAKKRSGSWATMVVKLRWTDSKGNVNETAVGAIDGSAYGAWKPTPSLKLATTLPLWASGQTITAQIVLDPEDYGGDWQVDDIYIDPFRRQ